MQDFYSNNSLILFLPRFQVGDVLVILGKSQEVTPMPALPLPANNVGRPAPVNNVGRPASANNRQGTTTTTMSTTPRVRTDAKMYYNVYR